MECVDDLASANMRLRVKQARPLSLNAAVLPGTGNWKHLKRLNIIVMKDMDA